MTTDIIMHSVLFANKDKGSPVYKVLLLSWEVDYFIILSVEPIKPNKDEVWSEHLQLTSFFVQSILPYNINKFSYFSFTKELIPSQFNIYIQKVYKGGRRKVQWFQKCLNKNIQQIKLNPREDNAVVCKVSTFFTILASWSQAELLKFPTIKIAGCPKNIGIHKRYRSWIGFIIWLLQNVYDCWNV